MYISKYFGRRSYLSIRPQRYENKRHSRFFYRWRALVGCLKAIIQGKPELMIAACVALKASLRFGGPEDPKFESVDYRVGPAGMVGLDFNLESGYKVGIWLREADWYELADRVKSVTKKGYLAAEDRGDPDLDPVGAAAIEAARSQAA
jgi:hypothetical protein